MEQKPINANKNQNKTENEISRLEKFETELKNNVFGVVYVLLKEPEMSIYTTFIFTVIQFIQLLIFPFHKTINEVWNSPKIVDVLETAFNYLNIVPYMENTNWSLYATFFYIGFAVVMIVVAMIVYISYGFNRKRLSFTWPILALKYLINTFITILYLPFLDYFVSMLACTKNINDVSVHSYFSEKECWIGAHALNTALTIIAIIFFVIITQFFSITYFEYKSISSDPNARVNSRPNALVLVYKTVMIICLTFLTNSDFQIVLLALILIGSVILFVKFYLSAPYHNETMSKLWSTLTAINLWTAVMIIFAKIMEASLFEGSIIAWLLGIPFVIMIILANRDPRIELLLINVNKFQSGQEVQDQIRYLLKLVEWQAKHRNSAILLDGYIEIHKQSCNKDDCPLKQKLAKNNRFTKNLMSQDETLNEKYALLIQLLYKMYSYGIKKFPNNTSLRIAYAFFLLEKMQSKQQALQELSTAEQNKPPLDEQFVIYRYKRIIEDQIAESQNEGQGGLDVVSEVAFQNQLRLLQANIEKCALLHMEFWSQLGEDHPDLAKLNDIGSKINSSVSIVEESWTKLIKINPTNAKAMRLYGKFLIEIINDKEAGDELLNKARNITNTQTNRRAAQMANVADDSNNDAAPTVWVSGEQDKFGLITGINLTAASLFGYNKTELLNRKVNALMPQIFAKHHDSFLEHYMNTGEGNLVGKNKERLAFGKNKSNYIFPMYYSVRVVQSIIQGIQFIATFRIEKNFKNAAYVLTHPDGTIDSISSSAISLLKVDLKVINQKKGNIQDLIPNIIKDRQSIFSHNNAGRSTATINYTYPKDSEYLLERDKEDMTTQFSCFLNELVFLAGRENAGYQFRFERIVDKPISAALKARISNFQFKFDVSKMIIFGEYAEMSTTSEYHSVQSQEDEILGGIIHNTENNLSEQGAKDLFGSAKKPQVEEEAEVAKIDYAAGIRTLRLVGGRAQEIDDDRDDDSEEGGEFSSKESSSQNSQRQQHQQLAQQEEDLQEEAYDIGTTFKSKKALATVVNDKSPPRSIKSLQLIINILGVIFLVVALVDYIIAINEFDKINVQIDLVDKSNLRLAEMMNVLSKVRDLHLVGIGLLRDIYPNQRVLSNQLQASLDAAKAIKEELEAKTSYISAEHLALLSQPTITLVRVDGSELQGLTQATETMLTRALDIVTRDPRELTENNPDYYFITYNLLNGFYKGLKDSSQYYASELMDRVDGKVQSFLLLMIGSIVGLVLALFMLFPILLQVNKSREEILGLFLDIPEKTVKSLYTKCEMFILNLQVGEDEDMVSEIDDEELDKPQDGIDAQEFVPRKKRKKFKNSGKSQHSFFIKFLIVSLILECYFLFTFISANLLLKDVSTLIPELNATSVAEPFFSFANNAERQLFINDTGFVILNTPPEEIATENNKAMFDLDSLILEKHSTNRKTHSTEYANMFNMIMMSNPCPELTAYVSLQTCTAFADQTVYQGMTVALSRHFENLRTLLSCYSKMRTSTTYTCNIQPVTPIALNDTNSTRVKVLNLLRTSQAFETDTMQHVYIRQTFRMLMQSFKKSLKESFDDSLTLRLGVFIVYIVALLFVYVFVWRALIRRLNNDIWRTKSMLNMIPLGVITRIKSIKIYIKKFWNDRNLSEA